MAGLTLITPTSDRGVAFAFCERWMERALRRLGEQDVQWIVVDDGHVPVECHLGQLHIRRPHSASPQESFLGNLLTGLNRAEHPKILFIEDDDWYAENYLRIMSDRLEEADITGERPARYYNIATRKYCWFRNREHASLCQTGIRAELLPTLLKFLQQAGTISVDLRLWKSLAIGYRRELHPASGISVGIKGLPGKQGLGVGHRLGRRHRGDESGSLLRKWIGTADADLYFDLFQHKAA